MRINSCGTVQVTNIGGQRLNLGLESLPLQHQYGTVSHLGRVQFTVKPGLRSYGARTKSVTVTTEALYSFRGSPASSPLLAPTLSTSLNSLVNFDCRSMGNDSSPSTGSNPACQPSSPSIVKSTNPTTPSDLDIQLLTYTWSLAAHNPSAII